MEGESGDINAGGGGGIPLPAAGRHYAASRTPPPDYDDTIWGLFSEYSEVFSDIINHSVVRFSDKIDGRVKTLLLSQKCWQIRDNFVQKWDDAAEEDSKDIDKACCKAATNETMSCFSPRQVKYRECSKATSSLSVVHVRCITRTIDEAMIWEHLVIVSWMTPGNRD